MEATADDIRELVEGLCNPKDKFAYQCLKRLEALSALSDGVYAHFDVFVDLLAHGNSYIRTRALRRSKPHSYPSTMVSLVQKDIQNALGEIEQ